MQLTAENETKSVYTLDGSKSRKSIVVDVDSQWIIAGDVDVKANVKLAGIDQVRKRYVVLHDHWTPFWNLRPSADHANSNATRSRRLDAYQAEISSL